MKRGQISIFIIFGVIILLIVGFLLYFQTSTQSQDSSDNVDENLEAQFKGQRQAQGVVRQCVQRVVNDGVTILRLQGGFINIPSDMQTMFIKSKYEIVPEGDTKKVRVAEGSFLEVPYYVTANEGLAAPKLPLMREQLKDYVKTRLPKCVGNLSAIRDEVKLNIQTGSVETDINLEENVLVKGKYLIKGRNNNIEWQSEDFSYNIPVQLSKMLGYSGVLAIAEVDDAYLERHLKQVISFHAYVGGEKEDDDLPPFSYTAFNMDNSHVKWSKPTVKQKMKRIFERYIPQLKIHGTRYNRSAAYDGFVEHYFSEDNTTRIDFVYDRSWPAEIDIQPSDGNLLKPNLISLGGQFAIPMLSLFEYNFKYHIKIPILVRIVDRESGHINPSTNLLEERGTAFYFFMETYICGNQIRECNPPVNYSQYYNMSLSEPEGYCENKDTRNITMNVTDRRTGDPVADASIHYECVNSECLVGFTNGSGKLSGQFPECVNGVVKAKHRDYGNIQNIMTINDATHPGKVVDMSLPPLMNVTVRPKGFDIRNFMIYHYLTDGFTSDACDGRSPSELLDNVKFDLKEQDKVLIRMEGRGENLIKKTFLYPHMRNVSLPEGNYTFSLSYIGNVSIAPSTYETGEDSETTVGFAGESPDYETYKGRWPLGSSTFDGDLRITENNQTVTFFIPAEHASTESLEVKSFDQLALGKEKINLTISADKDCDGSQEVIDYIIPQEGYEDYVEPKVQ